MSDILLEDFYHQIHVEMGGNREKETEKCRLLTFNGIFRKICLDPWFLCVFGIL